MPTLREIRKQLRAIENIKKITQAMEMVAASRLRRAQAQAEMSRPYAAKLKEVLSNLITVAADYRHPLMEARDVKTIGLLVIAADRGLCGSYNQNIFSAAEAFLKERPNYRHELILVGKKAADYFSRRKWHIKHQIKEWGGKITFSQVNELSDWLMHWFLDGEMDEIWMVHSKFITVMEREIVVEKLLNLEATAPQGSGMYSDYIFEPNPEDIFGKILPRYTLTKIQSALHEAYASELAARILSMRAATKNAEEMIEKQTLLRNKIRQSGITREMIEISSGAESTK